LNFQASLSLFGSMPATTRRVGFGAGGVGAVPPGKASASDASPAEIMEVRLVNNVIVF
jgi:hypothetical protein